MMSTSILIISAASLVCSVWSLVKVHAIGSERSQTESHYIVETHSNNVSQMPDNSPVHVDLDESLEYAREQAAKRGQWQG